MKWLGLVLSLGFLFSFNLAWGSCNPTSEKCEAAAQAVPPACSMQAPPPSGGDQGGGKKERCTPQQESAKNQEGIQQLQAQIQACNGDTNCLRQVAEVGIPEPPVGSKNDCESGNGVNEDTKECQKKLDDSNAMNAATKAACLAAIANMEQTCQQEKAANNKMPPMQPKGPPDMQAACQAKVDPKNAAIDAAANSGRMQGMQMVNQMMQQMAANNQAKNQCEEGDQATEADKSGGQFDAKLINDCLRQLAAPGQAPSGISGECTSLLAKSGKQAGEMSQGEAIQTVAELARSMASFGGISSFNSSAVGSKSEPSTNAVKQSCEAGRAMASTGAQMNQCCQAYNSDKVKGAACLDKISDNQCASLSSEAQAKGPIDDANRICASVAYHSGNNYSGSAGAPTSRSSASPSPSSSGSSVYSAKTGTTSNSKTSVSYGGSSSSNSKSGSSASASSKTRSVASLGGAVNPASVDYESECVSGVEASQYIKDKELCCMDKDMGTAYRAACMGLISESICRGNNLTASVNVYIPKLANQQACYDFAAQ